MKQKELKETKENGQLFARVGLNGKRIILKRLGLTLYSKQN